MNLRRSFIALLLITGGYIAALAWADARNDVFSVFPHLTRVLPALMAAALVSIGIRYARWHRLMTRAGHRLPRGRGFLAYCSGFAFTASPGKAGELFRMRYHGPLGVPPARVLSAFLFERAFDVICVLAWASLLAAGSPLFLAAFLFTGCVLAAVTAAAFTPRWANRAAGLLPVALRRRATPLLGVVNDGLAGTRLWLTAPDFLFSAAAGIAAWGTLALAFAWLLTTLEIHVAPAQALGAYPLAMLAGAASMIPGGLGSTEAAIIALLTSFGAAAGPATVAAIGIRLATLWFAIVLGILSIMALESCKPKSS